MARLPKPWLWKARDGWYVTIDGERHLLARGKDSKPEATKEFHRLMAAEKVRRRPDAPARVGEICNLYVLHARANLAPLTADFYSRHLESFAKSAGRVSVSDAAPRHVTAWLAKHPGWGQSTRSQAITAVKRAFRWAKREGHVSAEPFAEMEKPGVRARSAILTREQADAIRAAIRPGDPFGDFLDVMRDTGCRPSEAMAIAAANLDAAGRVVVMASKTTARTGRKRVIHLTDRVAARLSDLARRWPDGPLLRNLDGLPWTRFSTKSRFFRIRENLGMGPEATAESYRHLFATDALESGVPIASAAELMGHTSTAMLSRHYSKLADRHAHLKSELGKVRGAAQSPSPQDSGPQIASGALAAGDALPLGRAAGSASDAAGVKQDKR